MKARCGLTLLCCALPFALVWLSAQWRAEALAPLQAQRGLSLLVALRTQLAASAPAAQSLRPALQAAVPAQANLLVLDASGALQASAVASVAPLPAWWPQAMARYPAGWQWRDGQQQVLALPWPGRASTASFIVLTRSVPAARVEPLHWGLAALAAAIWAVRAWLEARRVRAVWRAAALRLQATLPDQQDDAIGHAARALQALRQRCDSIERQLNEAGGSAA